MLTKKPTKDMNREEWLAERRNSIGGSDAASILGLNPYNSAYALWAEKTGKVIPEDISAKESVREGNDLEDYVARRFTEATGIKVRRENNIIYNSDYPFAHANPDRMVIGENAGLECKTTSSKSIIQTLRDGTIPDNWYCQCTHYMAVTGAKRWYLAALVLGVEFFYFNIERNDGEIRALMDAESNFWAGVINNIPPALDGSEATTDAVKAIYADSVPDMGCDLTAVGYHVDCYNALTKQIKELETLRAGHENSIKDFMGQSVFGSYSGTTVSWKPSKRTTFNKKLYEESNGKIPQRFYTTTESRTFRVNTKE